MKRYRHTGLRGCVIMLSPWKYLTNPKKETDHENPRNASHPGRHRRQPAQSLVIGSHGFHRPFTGQITQKLSLRSKGGRRKTHGKYSFRRRRDPRNGGSSGSQQGLGHLLVPVS